MSEEEAIEEMFRFLLVILQSTESESFHQDLYEFLEMVIKESLFKVKSFDRLINIIDYISFISKDKSEQYKVVNLMWDISDHLKKLTLENQDQKDKSEEVWKKLFKKFVILAKATANGQTKQSCIHAFTQTIAESNDIIGNELFLSILKTDYLHIFYILMSFP